MVRVSNATSAPLVSHMRKNSPMQHDSVKLCALFLAVNRRLLKCHDLKVQTCLRRKQPASLGTKVFKLPISVSLSPSIATYYGWNIILSTFEQSNTDQPSTFSPAKWIVLCSSFGEALGWFEKRDKEKRNQGECEASSAISLIHFLMTRGEFRVCCFLHS